VLLLLLLFFLVFLVISCWLCVACVKIEISRCCVLCRDIRSIVRIHSGQQRHTTAVFKHHRHSSVSDIQLVDTAWTLLLLLATLPRCLQLSRCPVLRPTAWAQCATLTDLKVIRTYKKLPQEQKPVNITLSIQWEYSLQECFLPKEALEHCTEQWNERVQSPRNVLRKKHYSTALSNEMESCILILLTEGTTRVTA